MNERQIAALARLRAGDPQWDSEYSMVPHAQAFRELSLIVSTLIREAAEEFAKRK